jgi:hypothetical protein
MKPKGISRQKVAEIAAQHGFKVAAPDHPVYSEGPTIVFVAKRRRGVRGVAPLAVDLPMQNPISDLNALDDEESSISSGACPYCGHLSECQHRLLLVDRTHRGVGGGLLFAAFNELLDSLTQDAGQNGDRNEIFDRLVDEVEALSNAQVDYGFDGPPGMSSEMSAFYAETEEGVILARQSIEVRNA